MQCALAYWRNLAEQTRNWFSRGAWPKNPQQYSRFACISLWYPYHKECLHTAKSFTHVFLGSLSPKETYAHITNKCVCEKPFLMKTIKNPSLQSSSVALPFTYCKIPRLRQCIEHHLKWDVENPTYPMSGCGILQGWGGAESYIRKLLPNQLN